MAFNSRKTTYSTCKELGTRKSRVISEQPDGHKLVRIRLWYSRTIGQKSHNQGMTTVFWMYLRITHLRSDLLFPVLSLVWSEKNTQRGQKTELQSFADGVNNDNSYARMIVRRWKPARPFTLTLLCNPYLINHMIYMQVRTSMIAMIHTYSVSVHTSDNSCVKHKISCWKGWDKVRLRSREWYKRCMAIVLWKIHKE